MRNGVDVLVIDDRRIDAEMTLIALERSAPHARTLRVSTAEEALQYLFSVGEFRNCCKHLPGLVLLDVELPVVSGYCLLDLLRAHPHTSHVPVVMLSSSSEPVLFRHRGRFAANAYFVKPVEVDRYHALIRQLVAHWLPAVEPRGGVDRSGGRRRGGLEGAQRTLA